MLPRSDGPGPLEQPGQEGEDRRRVAPGRRRLAGGQADLALGHGEAGEAVHHQHDVAALVAEPLGDAGGGEGGPDAHEGGLVGGGHDDHRAGQAFGPEVVLDELADLAATFADQGQDDDGGVGAAGDHGQQARLADAGAGEDAHALAPTARHQGVDGAHAEGQLAVDHLAAQRVRCRTLDGDRLGVDEGGPVVDGPAQAVEDAAEQAVADLDAHGLERGLDGAPKWTPLRSPKGMQARLSPWTATTSASSTPPSRQTRTASPTAASMPSTSRRSPTSRLTRPVRRGAWPGAPRRGSSPANGHRRLPRRALQDRTLSGRRLGRLGRVGGGEQGPADPGQGGLDLGIDAAGAGVDDAAAPLDRFVGHHGDPAVGHVGLELGRLEDLFGVETHDQVVAGCGQAQGAADGGRDQAVGQGELVVDQGAGELDGERRRVLLHHGNGVGPAGLDGRGGLVQGLGALAQRVQARSSADARPPRARPRSRRRTPPGGPPRARSDGDWCLGDVGLAAFSTCSVAGWACSTARRAGRGRPVRAPLWPGLRRQGHRHPA